MQRIERIKKLIAVRLPLSKLQWFLVLFFSIIIYLSLGLGDYQSAVYRATIEPAENSNGPVKVVFYGAHYEDYLASGALLIPASGWHVLSLSDSTILTAEEHALPLAIYSEGEPIEVGLLHYADAGVARLVDGNNVVRLISLRSSPESVAVLTVGGESSDVLQSGSTIKKASGFWLAGVFFFILALLTLIARMQLRIRANKSDQATIVGWGEVAYFALPLFASTTVVWLAFWPVSTAHDGSLHWYHAVTRGNMENAYGITATLFMRLFSYFSASPAGVILFQSALSAVGVALILKELRYRGVPWWAAQIFSIALAILPQYPSFFNNLGKDALSAVGIIFLAWGLLSVTRSIKAGRLNYWSLVVLTAAAVFAGVVRIEVMPTAVFAIMLLVVFVFLQGRRTTALAFGVVFVVAAIFIPKVSLFLSDEQQAAKVAVGESQKVGVSDDSSPLGYLANFYIYHLFSAAVHSGIPLRTSDEELFYRISPRSAWEDYDCLMTDTTTSGVKKGLLLNKSEYAAYLKEHQRDMAIAILRIVKDNPSILIDRQICITKMLWYVGYGKSSFLATPTLGYDNPISEFKSIAGENKTILPVKIRATIQEYFGWSQRRANLWIFWKPALIFHFGLFCALSRLTVQRESGLLMMLSLTVALILVLALVIPFPAYRYAYPATLLMTLLCTLAFSRANNRPSQF